MGVTIFQGECADDVPTDASYVDPTHFHPGLRSGRLAIFEERDELAVCHATGTAPDRRVVDDVDDTLFAYITERGECTIPAGVDSWFRA